MGVYDAISAFVRLSCCARAVCAPSQSGCKFVAAFTWYNHAAVCSSPRARNQSDEIRAGCHECCTTRQRLSRIAVACSRCFLYFSFDLYFFWRPLSTCVWGWTRFGSCR
ncbi:Piso0_003559 [Millerozyma farinosa CBS 7064]|uniref:Piso0_003559 protein n=1 Tax=Pichia sorbitophila (strain ATCC MYA-4447 / BCRC 22081 / CBS 7064 / NBRC 10061 / NRRL Y-12695) TaxID=559304 RepID=G8YG91_PICSO|nr:Piso0_003559 [Millerozyma farinosa CBS 7064]CCE81208.1 Piso0_003559 [Millerozyma farinosa CBS 7064]